jgi:hypothetical protein
LDGQKLNTNDGEKIFFPITWSFGTARSRDNSEDMWYYFIKEKIINQIDDNFKKYPGECKLICDDPKYKSLAKRTKFRNKHLSSLIGLLYDSGFMPIIAIDEFTYFTSLVDAGKMDSSFLQQIRDFTIQEMNACFIFAGIYYLVDILNDSRYGINSQLANTIQYHVGAIDEKSAEELINVGEPWVQFTNDAVERIKLLSNNVPYFIQMICRLCAIYAREKKINIIGQPELENVIKILTGEIITDDETDLEMLIGQFQQTQYDASYKHRYNNAIISTIANQCKGLEKPKFVNRDKIISIWGDHGLKRIKQKENQVNYYPIIARALEELERRGVLIKRLASDEIVEYRIAVDFFRRWWAAQYPELDTELDKYILDQTYIGMS